MRVFCPHCRQRHDVSTAAVLDEARRLAEKAKSGKADDGTLPGSFWKAKKIKVRSIIDFSTTPGAGKVVLLPPLDEARRLADRAKAGKATGALPPGAVQVAVPSRVFYGLEDGSEEEAAARERAERIQDAAVGRTMGRRK